MNIEDALEEARNIGMNVARTDRMDLDFNENENLNDDDFYEQEQDVQEENVIFFSFF